MPTDLREGVFGGRPAVGGGVLTPACLEGVFGGGPTVGGGVFTPWLVILIEQCATCDSN